MKGFKLYLIIGSILLVLYVVMQLNKPAPTDWRPTYLSKDKIPYGTYILFNKMKDMVPGATVTKIQAPVYSVLKNSSFSKTTYLIVSPAVTPDTNDYVQMKKFATAGNNIFIATSSIGTFLQKELRIRYDSGFGKVLVKDNESVNFTNPNLRAAKDYMFDRNIGDRTFLAIDTAHTVVLGETENGRANFIKYPVGKGAIFILADPGFLSNYNMLQPRGAEYAGKVLSYIGPNNNIIYDEYFSGQQAGGRDILRFFFQNESLRYAYYLAAGAFLLFLLFEIKRRQRVIPVAEPFTNTTIEFVDVVTSLYFKQKDNKNIAGKKIAYFFDHLRNHYFWRVNPADEEFETALEAKTGIDAKLAKELVEMIRYVGANNNISNEVLKTLDKLTETFYNQTK